MPTTPSSSNEQQAAEAVVLAVLSEDLGYPVVPQRVQMPGGAHVDVDGAAEEPWTFVEVFAHQGALRGGQRHKVSTDALKLITLRQARPEARLILAFCDEVAASSLNGRGWQAEALRAWDIEVRVVEIDDLTREGIRAAQVRQRMVNVPTTWNRTGSVPITEAKSEPGP